MRRGTMKHDVHLLSTSLKLQAGQVVKLIRATNIPQGGLMYYARPADGVWSDGVDHDDQHAILIDEKDLV